jgi:hypothetical protein
MEPIIITPQPEWSTERTVWATLSLPTDMNVLEIIITQCPRPAGIEMYDNAIFIYTETLKCK